MTSNTFAAPENLSEEQLAVVSKHDPMQNDDYRGPRTLIVGCGGCGINLARLVAADSGANTLLVDTGRANVRPHENVFVIGDGDGSGGVQDKNAENAVKQLPAIDPDQMGKTDIAVVTFSMSGGSGSFIGPYVIKTLLSRGIQCVAMGLMDYSSLMQAENTLSALDNLDALAVKAKVTLPMMVFDNRALSRDAMNAVIADKGRILIRLLMENAMEVDRNDRRHFLDGTVTHEAKPGLRLLNVFESNLSSDGQPLFPTKDTEIFDSILHIRGEKNGRLVDFEKIPELAHFRKDGHFVSSEKPVLGLITADLSCVNAPLKKITDLQERHAVHNKLGGPAGIALPKSGSSKTKKFF